MAVAPCGLVAWTVNTNVPAWVTSPNTIVPDPYCGSTVRPGGTVPEITLKVSPPLGLLTASGCM